MRDDFNIFSTWCPQSFPLLAVAGPHADAGLSFVVGPPVTDVYALALVHAVAGTHAFASVSYLLLAVPVLASMILS
jgi:hypothetical protein